MSKKFYQTCVVSPVEQQIDKLPDGTWFTWNCSTWQILHHYPNGDALVKKFREGPLFHFCGKQWVLPSQSQIELTLF